MALMCKVLHPMHWGKIGLKWVGLLTVTMVLVGTNARAGDGPVHFYDGLSCPTGARFDHQGAVVVDYGPPLGLRHNPVTVSQYAIACHRSFQMTRARKYWQIFVAQIRYLREH